MGRISFSKIENRAGKTFEYHPHVGYQYEVDGHHYFSEIIYPECSLGRQSWAQSVVARYPPQGSCLVYYSPQHPGYAVLEPGVHPHSFIFTGVGAMLVYGGSLAAIAMLRVARRPLVPPALRRGEVFVCLALILSFYVGVAVFCWLP